MLELARGMPVVEVLLTAAGLGGDGCATLLSGAAVTEGLTVCEPAGRMGNKTTKAGEFFIRFYIDVLRTKGHKKLEELAKVCILF